MPQSVNFQDIISQFQAAQTAANTANEQRYKELLAALNNLGARTGGTYEEILGDLSNLGDSQRQRVDQNAARMWGQAEQDLISRGLGNTTLRFNAKRSVAEDAEQRMQEIDEQMSRQKAGEKERGAAADIDITRMLAGAIEGRNDIGPDLSTYANLLQQAAAAGDGSKLQAAVGRGPSPGGGLGGVSYGSRGGGFGERAAGGGAPSGGTGARIVGPGANVPYDLINPTQRSVTEKQDAMPQQAGPTQQQIQQQALNILQSTAGGMVPDASYMNFSKQHGKDPKAWLRENAVA